MADLEVEKNDSSIVYEESKVELPHPSLGKAIILDDNGNPAGYNFLNITGQDTIPVKLGPGFLHSIVINKPVSGGTIAIYNKGFDAGTLIGTITSGSTTTNQPVVYDVYFSEGLQIVTGAQNQDITVTYV